METEACYPLLMLKYGIAREYFYTRIKFDLQNDFSGSKVVSLSLSKNPLSGRVPQSFFHGLTYLQVFDLSNTSMLLVQKYLSQLTCLEFLSLGPT